jgi:HEAT repeat protein
MLSKIVVSVSAILCVLMFLFPSVVRAADSQPLMEEIDRAASQGEKVDPTLLESLITRIEKDSKSVLSPLLGKLKDASLKEEQQAMYVWALGFTQDSAAIEPLTALHRQSKSEVVQASCLTALARIGGDPAGKYLLSALDAAPTTGTQKSAVGTSGTLAGDNESGLIENKRFQILFLLAQMQYEPALPQMAEALKANSEKGEPWQAKFLFGMMGDKAVPFLMKKLGDEDENFRTISAYLLGIWLMAPESAQPMQERYWVEKDLRIRGMILGSLERIIPDLAVMKTFFEQVVAKEKEKELLQYARETLENQSQIKSAVADFAKNKKVSAEVFEGERKKLYDSCGKKGDYDLLSAYSTVKDEVALKALRERILQRASDEAFYDFEKVNQTIMFNRLMSAQTSPTGK